MSTAHLDLQDSNVQLWHGSRRVQSPGYALLAGKEYMFGAPARASARLQPRDINTRFWWRLSTEALQPALGPARHTGDLAHAHLQQLHGEADKPGEVLLAVPGSMQREQLALLLGIMQQCPFDPVGLVNRSVALGSLFQRQERLFHLEIQLHQSLVSELAAEGDNVHLHRTTPLPGCGLLQLQERLVEIIAAEFVRQTRFDPRRKAATEQQLYDALPGALHTLRSQQETNLDVNGYQARIGAAELQAAGGRLIDSAGEAMGNGAHPIIADPLAGLLPGLDSAFEGLHVLRGEDIRTALQQHQEQLIQRQQALSFVNALPFLGVQTLAVKQEIGAPIIPAPITPPVEEPTHLLQGHTARTLDSDGTALAEGWSLYRAALGWQLRGEGTPPRVNDSEYQEGQILGAGDSITTGNGESALLIEVTA